MRLRLFNDKTYKRCPQMSDFRVGALVQKGGKTSANLVDFVAKKHRAAKERLNMVEQELVGAQNDLTRKKVEIEELNENVDLYRRQAARLGVQYRDAKKQEEDYDRLARSASKDADNYASEASCADRNADSYMSSGDGYLAGAVIGGILTFGIAAIPLGIVAGSKYSTAHSYRDTAEEKRSAANRYRDRCKDYRSSANSHKRKWEEAERNMRDYNRQTSRAESEIRDIKRRIKDLENRKTTIAEEICFWSALVKILGECKVCVNSAHENFLTGQEMLAIGNYSANERYAARQRENYCEMFTNLENCALCDSREIRTIKNRFFQKYDAIAPTPRVEKLPPRLKTTVTKGQKKWYNWNPKDTVTHTWVEQTRVVKANSPVDLEDWDCDFLDVGGGMIDW